MFGSKYKKMQKEFLVSKFIFLWVCVIMIEFFGFVSFLVHVLDETRSKFMCILGSNFFFLFIFHFVKIDKLIFKNQRLMWMLMCLF